MCLTIVENRFESYLPVSGVGYKHVYIDIYRGNPMVYLCDGYYPVNKWVNAKTNTTINVLMDNYYQSGFHVFLKKKDAIRYGRYGSGIIVKVKYKNIVCVGKQYNGNVGKTVVARQMFIEYKPPKTKVKKKR